MRDSLQNKEIILAGGTGGLGAATASLLAEERPRLFLSYLSNRERAEKLIPIATILQADLRSGRDRKRLLDAAPHLHALVVFTGSPARLPDPVEAMQLSYETNYVGPILLAREAAGRMRDASTPGSIVLISTMQAAALFPGSTAYAGPKAALLHAARILAKECRGPSNIRVNVICPGVNQAGMAEASIAAGKYDRYIEEGQIPRFGRAIDVARAVRFFLQPDNYVTGQVLTVDGGLTL
ncbi:MAG: SDR family oxidoreductase [Acidobacteriia bacterium]|nr:SDR family oxidoreductase [Terriglobia bacterium]